MLNIKQCQFYQPVGQGTLENAFAIENREGQRLVN